MITLARECSYLAYKWQERGEQGGFEATTLLHCSYEILSGAWGYWYKIKLTAMHFIQTKICEVLYWSMEQFWAILINYMIGKHTSVSYVATLTISVFKFIIIVATIFSIKHQWSNTWLDNMLQNIIWRTWHFKILS